jgi:putative membrane protein
MSSSIDLVRIAGRMGLAFTAALLVGACAKKENAADTATAAATTPPAMSDTARPAAASAAAAPTLTDAQIAHVAVTANSIDSAAGAAAKGKGTAKAVKDFAQTMVTDHTGVNKQATALAKKLNVTPEDNDVSRQLKTNADQAASSLQGKSGADFDKAYIDNEVTYHQGVLDALDKTLIPGAQNAELKSLLEKVRPNIAAHLARAKNIQGTLGAH